MGAALISDQQGITLREITCARRLAVNIDKIAT